MLAHIIVGMVTLSPIMVAQVCRIGDPHQLTCAASVEFLQWSLTLINEHEEIVVFSNSRDVTQQLTQRVNSTTFTFTRNSARGSLPLISTVSIDSVSIGLNRTVVRCTDVANPMSSASTTIHTIDIST